MPVTDTFALRYPSIGDQPNIPLWFENLAEDTDDQMASVRDALLGNLGNVKGITVGSRSMIAPSGGGITSTNITGLTTAGTNFLVIAGCDTAFPDNPRATGSLITATGFTLYFYRSTTTQTAVYFAHIGYA